MNNSCGFNLVADYEENSEAMVIQHISNCSDCLGEFSKIEEFLSRIYINSWPDRQEAQNVDEILWENISTPQISSMIRYEARKSAIESYQNKKVPDYLKKIVFDKLGESSNVLNKINILIGDRLKIIGDFMNDLLTSLDIPEPVLTRGYTGSKKENFAALEFFQKIDGVNLKYHLVSDGPGTVLLTLQVNTLNATPMLVSLRTEEQLVSSKRTKDSIVQFEKLGAGEYQIETSLDNKQKPIFIPITLIS